MRSTFVFLQSYPKCSAKKSGPLDYLVLDYTNKDVCERYELVSGVRE